MTTEQPAQTKIYDDQPAEVYPRQDIPRTRDPKLLLIRAINSIISMPQSYRQEAWHCETSCGTTHCFFGWIECHYFGVLIGADDSPRRFRYIDQGIRKTMSAYRGHTDDNARQYLHADLQPSYSELCASLIFGTEKHDGYAAANDHGFLQLAECGTAFHSIYQWVCEYLGLEHNPPADFHNITSYPPLPEEGGDA